MSQVATAFKLDRKGLAGAIRLVNCAFCCAVVAGAVLIAMDLPHPSSLADEGRQVLFTFVWAGSAVVVMFLANLLQKHIAKAAPQVPAHPGPGGMTGQGAVDPTSGTRLRPRHTT